MEILQQIKNLLNESGERVKVNNKFAKNNPGEFDDDFIKSHPFKQIVNSSMPVLIIFNFYFGPTAEPSVGVFRNEEELRYALSAPLTGSLHAFKTTEVVAKKIENYLNKSPNKRK